MFTNAWAALILLSFANSAWSMVSAMGESAETVAFTLTLTVPKMEGMVGIFVQNCSYGILRQAHLGGCLLRCPGLGRRSRKVERSVGMAGDPVLDFGREHRQLRPAEWPNPRGSLRPGSFDPESK